jgi:hypothetical protein
VEAREAGLAAIGEAKALWLDKDGLLTVAGVISNEWFGRGLNPNPSSEKLHVNPLVLCEYALEFCRFVHRILMPRVERGAWLYRVVARGLQSRAATHLTPGDHRALSWPDEAHPASTDGFVEEVLSSDSPAKDAYRIVATIYAHYGLPPSAIPFTDNEALSEQQIAQIR